MSPVAGTIRGIALIAVCATLAQAQNPPRAQPDAPSAQLSDSAKLYAEIAAADSAMFDAFNRCDATAMAGFFTADMEFYHDWGGQVGPRDRFIAGFADGCRKGEVGRRELVGRMEVHLVRNVGALQIGTHRFFVRNADGTERPGSIARLITLWRREDGVWRATRVFSFDHQPQR